MAARERVEHVALTPAPIAATIGGYAWHYVFLAGLVDWFARANRDTPGGYVGFGAFNLVRTSTHRAFGGHEPLRLTVLDDVRLGLLVRRAGGRCRAFLGGEDVRCHWGTTLGEGIRLTEKNYFAAARYRGGLVCLLAVFVTVLLGRRSPPALASGTVLGLVAGLSGGLLALPAIVFSRRLRWPFAGRAAGAARPLDRRLRDRALGGDHVAPRRGPMARHVLSAGGAARRRPEVVP